jgi:hypothetical protein
LGNPKVRLFGIHRRRCEDNIRMDLREKSGKFWTGFIWLRIGANGGLL